MARSVANPFDTDEFRALRAEWYAKLKADGFDDIEENRDEPAFDVDSAFRDFDYRRAEQRAKDLSGAAAYYTIAQQWMDRGRWRSRRERFYFNEWAFGRDIKDIHANHPVDPQISYSRIVDVFRELRKEMVAVVSVEDGLEEDDTLAMLAAYEMADPELSDDPKDWCS